MEGRKTKIALQEPAPEETPSQSDEKGFLRRSLDYFWDKIFDKLLLIIISGVIIFLYQEHSKHSQKIRDESIAAARIYTEILIKQRAILMETIGEYMQLLEELTDRGIATKEDLIILRSLRKKVLVVLNTLYPIDENIKKYADPLKKAIEKPSIDLTRKRSKEYIQQISDKILTSYLNFLEELGKLTRKKVKDEIEKAEKEFSKTSQPPLFRRVLNTLLGI
jgi:hypothetical protein